MLSVPIRLISLVAITLGTLWWRRPDQIQQPALWFEEGTQLLMSYANCGICAVWRPVNGNNLLSTKLTLLPAFGISIAHAPEIAIGLTCAFTCFVVLSIAFAPTHLKASFLCAIATLLIPTGAENYGVSLYTFWWSGLLIVLALLWDTDRGFTGWRVAFLILGGLSSPIMIVWGPLFVIRAYFDRRPSEVRIAILACVLTAIAVATNLSHAGTDKAPDLSLSLAYLTVAKFFGMLFVADLSVAFLAGCSFLLLLALFMALSKKKLDLYFGLLIGGAGLAIFASIIRAPIDVLSPYGAGQRYFFYSDILLCFVLLWLWKSLPSANPIRFAPLALLVGAVISGILNLNFRFPPSGAPSWSNSIAECALSDGDHHIEMPMKWFAPLTGELCRSMLSRDIL